MEQHRLRNEPGDYAVAGMKAGFKGATFPCPFFGQVVAKFLINFGRLPLRNHIEERQLRLGLCPYGGKAAAMRRAGTKRFQGREMSGR